MKTYKVELAGGFVTIRKDLQCFASLSWVEFPALQSGRSIRDKTKNAGFIIGSLGASLNPLLK